MRRLLRAALVLWVGRWALRQLAARAGRHWLPTGPPPVDSPVQPGTVPPRQEAPNE